MDAPGLFDIRREIEKLYRKRGGEGALFQAESFWPHVTVGFTYRDMFLEDGVFKGLNSCFGNIQTVGQAPRRKYGGYDSERGGDDAVDASSGNDDNSWMQAQNDDDDSVQQQSE